MKLRWVHAPAIRAVLRGNYTKLDGAFDWNPTPQGHNYWYRRYVNLEPLDFRDLVYLALLLEQKKEKDDG